MNSNANFKQWKTEETKFKIACESHCQVRIFVPHTRQNTCFVSKLISQNGWYKRAIERNLNQLSFQTSEILSKTCWMTYVKSITLDEVKPRVRADQIKQEYITKTHRPKTDSILSHTFTYSSRRPIPLYKTNLRFPIFSYTFTNPTYKPLEPKQHKNCNRRTSNFSWSETSISEHYHFETFTVVPATDGKYS